MKCRSTPYALRRPAISCACMLDKTSSRTSGSKRAKIGSGIQPYWAGRPRPGSKHERRYRHDRRRETRERRWSRSGKSFPKANRVACALLTTQGRRGGERTGSADRPPVPPEYVQQCKARLLPRRRPLARGKEHLPGSCRPLPMPSSMHKLESTTSGICELSRFALLVAREEHNFHTLG